MQSKIRQLGSEYYDCVLQNDTDGARLVRQKIENAMSELSISDQKQLVDQLEFGALAVNGQGPRESAGYGVVRDVFCTNLLGECINISATRLARMQSIGNSQFDAKAYDDRVKNCMMQLSDNQFEAFQNISENSAPSDELEDSARNRQIYALNHVKGLMREVASVREKENSEAEN